MIYIFCLSLIALGLLIRALPNTKNGLLFAVAIGVAFWAAVVSAFLLVAGGV